MLAMYCKGCRDWIDLQDNSEVSLDRSVPHLPLVSLCFKKYRAIRAPLHYANGLEVRLDLLQANGQYRNLMQACVGRLRGCEVFEPEFWT